VGQVVVIAGRTAEMGDITKRRAQGGEDHFFTAGQAIEQGQGKAIALDRRQGVAATAAHQAFDHLLRVDQAEVLDLIDQLGGDGKVRVVKPHRRHAIAPVPLGCDLAGTGATHHTNTTETVLQGLAEGLQVVGGRAEEQHETQVRVQQLARQLIGHLPRLAGLGHGCDYAFAVHLLHGHLPVEAQVYERAGWRPMLLGYWVGASMG